jgi:hypothetical protein
LKSPDNTGLFFFYDMVGRYFLSSLLRSMLGAACVLIAIHVTNMEPLITIEPSEFSRQSNEVLTTRIDALHSRINDFYIFAGIVITLLLAINFGVIIKADNEVEAYMNRNFREYREKIESMSKESEDLVGSIRADAIMHRRKLNQQLKTKGKCE